MKTENSDEPGAQPLNYAEIVRNKSLWYRFWKRFFDIVLSVFALIALSPVFLITAVFIVREDGFPVIFAQKRNGLNGKPFRMYKFRSMCRDAEAMREELSKYNELDGPAFKMKSDPRITKVGKFIRRTSVDELPQLANIIRGEMSIVGPRPLPTYETARCSDYENQRLLVKPGLTCYWQVNGRNDTSFSEWMEMDLRYIRDASLWTDFKLICSTFGAILRGGGRLLVQIVLYGRIYRILKRVFDIIFSALALILLSPVFLMTAVAIFMEDRRPVFYAQKRAGLREKPFLCYKFRSMRKNAEETHEQLRKEYGVTDVSFKLKHDPRVTKVGAFIRKYNIDELPQLWNILRGEMSFVGPRPLPDYEYREERARYGNAYSARYSVMQGLTCTWQISNRSERTFSERMRMDVDYAERCNLGLDMKLFFLTLIYAITGKAAY